MSKYSDPITATGSLITLDAPYGGIFDSLSVPITPTQDLHGYSHPWPAGGGVNAIDPSQFPKTISGTSYVSIPISQAFIQKMKTSGCAMHIDGTLGEGKTRFAIYAWNGTNNEALYIGGSQYLNTNNNFTLSGTISSKYIDNVTSIRIYAQPYNGSSPSTINNVYFQVGTDTSIWYPYSNICPISGRTGLSVYVSPTQDPDDATTYAVDWSTQAGTVYHGTVDVVTGVLTVDWAYKEFNGTEGWFASGNYIGLNNAVDYASKDNNDTTQISNIFVGAGAYYANYNSFRVQTNKAVVVGNKNEDGTVGRWADATAFKSFLAGLYSAGTPFAVCYELATPITYQLTPMQISALVGSNNVWVDTSAVITLIYRLLQVDRQTDRTSIGKRAESLDVLGKFSSISKVEVNVTENLFYEAGDSSGRTLTVDCPFGTQAMANNLLAMLQGYVYQPFEARRSIANPATELGDGVTVGDVYGGIYAIYHKCGPLHLADLSAPADEEIDHEYKFTPAFERKVERRLNNMQSELSVQAGEISAKVDRQGGDPSSVSWKMDADVFKVAVDGSDVLTVNENGLTVNGNGTFTGSVQAKNIQYGGSAGTMSGNGITSRSIGTGRLTSGINTSLGNADYSADVFSGAVVARFMKANEMSTIGFSFNKLALKLNTRTVKDESGNNLTIKYLGVY